MKHQWRTVEQIFRRERKRRHPTDEKMARRAGDEDQSKGVTTVEHESKEENSGETLKKPTAIIQAIAAEELDAAGDEFHPAVNAMMKTGVYVRDGAGFFRTAPPCVKTRDSSCTTPRAPASGSPPRAKPSWITIDNRLNRPRRSGCYHRVASGSAHWHPDRSR